MQAFLDAIRGFFQSIVTFFKSLFGSVNLPDLPHANTTPTGPGTDRPWPGDDPNQSSD